MKRQIEEVSYDFTISNIVFPAITGSKFRMISTWDADQQKATMKLEKLRSTQQWELAVTDITKHGPPGLPQGAIFKGLKSAMEKLLPGEADGKAPEKAKSVDNEPEVQATVNTDGSIT